MTPDDRTGDKPADSLTTPSFRLDGRTALVTGAGRGLGVGAAIALAEAGADLVLMSRTAADLEQTAAKVAAAGGRSEIRVCDVTDDDAVRDTLGSLPALDILINNAGTNIPQPFVAVETTALDTMLALNVRAAFITAQAATRRMLRDPDRKRRGGAIINISSQLGHVGLVDRSVYAMTKHALEGLTKGMAIELAPYNIRVNALAPTWVETPMTGPALADPDFRKFIIDQVPMGHLATIPDIMGAIVFLASPAAAMINGASLVVDGGWTAR